MSEEGLSINMPHHLKQELCTTRPPYRQGKKLTSVKVYTVNNESQHLLIYNVPAINIDSELQAVCQRFGNVTKCCRIPVGPDQELEDFTNVFHVRYDRVYHARLAKKKMDNLSFFGGILHVCYAPELETVEETKDKLSTRRKEVSFHLKQSEFPKQFRPRSVKRKLQLQQPLYVKEAVSYDNFSYNFINQGGEDTSYTSQPGPSGVQQTPVNPAPSQPSQMPPRVDIKPFKNLIPTKVSRIIFHKKTEKPNNS